MKRGAYDKATNKYAYTSTTREPCCPPSIAEFAHGCLIGKTVAVTHGRELFFGTVVGVELRTRNVTSYADAVGGPAISSSRLVYTARFEKVRDITNETRLMTHDEATAAHDLSHILRAHAARAREAALREAREAASREAREKQRAKDAETEGAAAELAATKRCLNRQTMFSDEWWRVFAPKYSAQLHCHMFGFESPAARRAFFQEAFAGKPTCSPTRRGGRAASRSMSSTPSRCTRCGARASSAHARSCSHEAA